jgi:hypothetical protein
MTEMCSTAHGELSYPTVSIPPTQQTEAMYCTYLRILYGDAVTSASLYCIVL